MESDGEGDAEDEGQGQDTIIVEDIFKQRSSNGRAQAWTLDQPTSQASLRDRRPEPSGHARGKVEPEKDPSAPKSNRSVAGSMPGAQRLPTWSDEEELSRWLREVLWLCEILWICEQPRPVAHGQ